MFGRKPLKVLSDRLREIVSPESGDYLIISDESDSGILKRALVSALVAIGVAKTSNTGSAILPVGTTAQRDGSPQAGYIRFNDDTDQFEGYNGTAWAAIGAGATGGSGDQVFVENEYVVTADYTIPSGRSAQSVCDSSGNMTINTGVTVTISTGSVWRLES
jgi:hypothetical protein